MDTTRIRTSHCHALRPIPRTRKDRTVQNNGLLLGWSPATMQYRCRMATNHNPAPEQPLQRRHEHDPPSSRPLCAFFLWLPRIQRSPARDASSPLEISIIGRPYSYYIDAIFSRTPPISDLQSQSTRLFDVAFEGRINSRNPRIPPKIQISHGHQHPHRMATEFSRNNRNRYLRVIYRKNRMLRPLSQHYEALFQKNLRAPFPNQ